MEDVSPEAAKKKQDSSGNKKAPEYNPRWKGYVYIALSSLVNFSSIANIQVRQGLQRGSTLASMSYGVITFLLSTLILIQDRSQRCLDPFHYTKAFNGRFEGYTLLFCVLWWVVGVAYITKVDGIAYVANNIYYTAWLCLFSSIYTLNKWSASKDILSISELTGLSSTLKSWYLVFLSSLVVLGTCVDFHSHLDKESREDASFGVALGTVSLIVAVFFISVHYDFITVCEEGGWLELSSSFFLIMLWIIGLAILTRDQGIAATLSGTKCGRRDLNRDRVNFFDDPTCTVVMQREVVNETASGTTEAATMSPSDVLTMVVEETIACNALGRQVPGSNLYFAAWTAFAASLNITFRWKADQAMQFAQAHRQQQQQGSLQQANLEVGEDGDDNSEDEDENDEDAI